MAFSDYYNATFDGTGFMEQYQSHFSAPRPAKKLEYTSRKVPGGDRTIIESTGIVRAEFSVPIACLEANLDTLESKVGSKKQLVRRIGTLSNVVLLAVQDQVRIQGSEGIWKATLVFIEAS